MLDKDEYNEDDVDDYGNDGDHEIEGSSHDIEVGETQTAPSQPQPVAKQDSSIVVLAPLQAFYGIDKSILILNDFLTQNCLNELILEAIKLEKHAFYCSQKHALNSISFHLD